ncbi:hypothetical protein BGZ95_000363 [Linnemannia exigua]|uniref:Uncharacterized protein n=1 Tax=Linnemannia exigua TaxID=604196 RepID=A0AAD4DAG5_9FUNG|nr:hypothetical protein BGZ95_000363 [Linnemannia exigua]
MDSFDITEIQVFKKGFDDLEEVNIVAHHHSDSDQHVVFWDDIRDAIPRATSIYNGNVIVPHARNHAYHLDMYEDSTAVRTYAFPSFAPSEASSEDSNLGPIGAQSSLPHLPIEGDDHSDMYEDSPAVRTHAFPSYAPAVASPEATNPELIGAQIRPDHLPLGGDDHRVMTTSATAPPSEPASIYSSTLCSEETTDEPHFKRLHVPTEAGVSDTDEGRSESAPYDAEIELILSAFRQYERKRSARQRN